MAVALGRGDNELASAHTGKASLAHQPSNALAADANSLGRQLGMDARRAVGAARGRMRRTDFADQRRIPHCTPRRPPLYPRIVATKKDTQQPTHAGNRIVRLVIAHELEPFRGIVFVSRANQAAAFDRISRSSLSWRFSRRSRESLYRRGEAGLSLTSDIDDNPALDAPAAVFAP